MVGYVHDPQHFGDSDPEHNTVKSQSGIKFNEERNVYVSCPQSLIRKMSIHDDEPEETTETYIFSPPQEGVYIEIIDTPASGTDESMTHGCTHNQSRTDESIS
jgi:hypothetical protein